MTYNNFNDLSNPSLRTWNRCATFFNIVGDHGTEEGTKYTSQFDDTEKQEMRDMFIRIRKNGYEKTRTAVNREAQKHVH